MSNILRLHEGSATSADCVVYVMSRDQRVADNHALVEAQKKASELSLPLIVVFLLYERSGVRAYEHAKFMLQGLEQVASRLEELGIKFVLRSHSSIRETSHFVSSLKPGVLLFDFSPLKGPRSFAKTLSRLVGVPSYVVDAHNIIPVWEASDKLEFAAYTFRPKVHAKLKSFLIEPSQVVSHSHYYDKHIDSLSFENAYEIINAKYPKRNLTIGNDSGEHHAHTHLTSFISNGLHTYADARNDIASDGQSGLSPYLHFGQISSLRVALDVMKFVGVEPLLFREAKMPSSSEMPTVVDGMNALFEEMIVRKELSDNFCFYSDDYMTLKGAHAWAQQTLNEHAKDRRDYVYALEELEQGVTHDTIWNTAQKELIRFGKMHGYMRMYWAKKILEWSNSPEDAVRSAIYLNDAYSIDGGDPNGYVGILWAIAGLHDRAWVERPVFGKIRYMNEAGLRRKFDVDAYIKRVSS